MYILIRKGLIEKIGLRTFPKGKHPNYNVFCILKKTLQSNKSLCFFLGTWVTFGGQISDEVSNVISFNYNSQAGCSAFSF